MLYQSIILSISIIAVFMTLMFFLSLIKKDNSIVDTAYGIGFILIALGTTLVFNPSYLVAAIVTSCICVWAVRLSSRIYLRNRNKPEDFRYKKWRDTWTYFKTRSFFQIYVLQGAIILAISTPVIFLNGLYITDIVAGASYYTMLVIGLLIWIVGFIFEAVGDYQLDHFIKENTRKKEAGEDVKINIMKKGLWSLTRHPNYFGEVSMWWGIWIMSLSILPSFPIILLAVISPITITFLLLKVSGIPMLEEKYKGDPEFDQYKKEVNAFFPWKN